MLLDLQLHFHIQFPLPRFRVRDSIFQLRNLFDQMVVFLVQQFDLVLFVEK
jgi:hypothetical protein